MCRILRKWGILGFIALFPFSSALAAPGTEMCGNGIDDSEQRGGTAAGTKGSCPAGYHDALLGNGCDADCPGQDKYNSGYNADGSLGQAGTTSKDCGAKNIYPGVHVQGGCSGSNYKTCQNSGTLTSCQTGPLAEGATHNYYIDCGAGNDLNPGTYASPFQTWGKVSGGVSGTPSSPVTLVAGDHVYLIGTSSCTTAFSDGTRNVIGHFPNGTSANPIVFEQYPGSTAAIANSNGPDFVTGAYNWFFHFQNLSSARTTEQNAATIYNNSVDGLRVENNYFSSLGGNGDNNDSFVLDQHSHNTNVNHNLFRNPLRTTGNVQNLSATNFLDNPLTGEGSGKRFDFNTCWFTSFSSSANGNCFFQKHGPTSADVGPAGVSFKNNSFMNYAQGGIRWTGSGLRATGNQFYSDPSTVPFLLFFDDSIVGSNFEDNRFQYNSVYGSLGISWNYPYYLPNESLKLDHNVIVSTAASFVSGNHEGILDMDGYGSDQQFGDFASFKKLTSNNNCFYCPNATCNYAYFSIILTGGGHGPAGNTGGNYSFANWKTNASQDALSVEKNPNFDTVTNAALDASCSGFGFNAAPAPTSNAVTSTLPIQLFLRRWRHR